MTCDDHNYNFHVCLTIFFFRYIIGKNTHLVFMNCFLETDILFCCIFKQICNFPQNLKENMCSSQCHKVHYLLMGSVYVRENKVLKFSYLPEFLSTDE